MNEFLFKVAQDFVMSARKAARGRRKLPPFDVWWLVDIGISSLQVLIICLRAPSQGVEYPQAVVYPKERTL